MWSIWLVLPSSANRSSSSALGYGRTVNVQQQYLDHCPSILDHPRATSEDGRTVAEIQLYLIALRLQNNPQRLRFAETEYEEIERWKVEWAHLLSTSTPPCHSHPTINPFHCKSLTPPTANEGHSTLELSVWFTQLLLHRTATRLHPDTDRLSPEICSNARLIISRSLQTRFPAAPGLIDNVYYILGYATLTLRDYYPSDQLIDQVRAFLLHLAPTSDHIAYQIAFIVGEVQRRYSEAAAADQSSPDADVLKSTLFGPAAGAREDNMDLTQLMPVSGSMETLVGGYGCFDQLIPPGYGPPQPGFEAPAMFQQHSPVTGGAMPVSLVSRMIHDF